MFEPSFNICTETFGPAAIHYQTTEYCRIGTYGTNIIDTLGCTTASVCAEWGYGFARQGITCQKALHGRSKMPALDGGSDNQRVVLVHVLHLCFQFRAIIALQLSGGNLYYLLVRIGIRNNRLHFYDVTTYKVVDMVGDCPGVATP